MIVSPESTVKDIKLAIQRQISDLEEPLMAPRKISWKYVWKRWVLSFGTFKLTDDKATASSIGLSKDAELTFSRIELQRNQNRRPDRRS